MATKKDFKKSNPALAFISGVEEVQEKDLEEAPPKEPQSAKGQTDYKINMEMVEKKNKRLQCLITPSTFKALHKLANKKHVSMNEIVNRALAEYIEKR